LLKVDNPISLDVLVSNNSSLLHHKIHKLGRTEAVHKINYLPDLQKRKSSSSRRMKTFWQTVKRCELGLEHICASPYAARDPRPFIPVHLLDRTVYGLLDSGASISCVGGSLAVEVDAGRVPFRAMEGNAVTADGSPQRIVRRIKVEIKYANIKKSLPIYIVPSLKHDLYLGIDFWKQYDLFPKV